MQVKNNTSETEKPSYDASYPSVSWCLVLLSSYTDKLTNSDKLCDKKLLDLI